MRPPILRKRRPGRRPDVADTPAPTGLMAWLIGFFLDNRVVVLLALAGLVAAGVFVAPFAWKLGNLPRSPVPVDAIPDLGENQQIVFTEWPGRSPADVEDQVTYPLTSVLLGTTGVKTVRATSMLGFSSIYVIFEENVDFYWSRTRLLERLNSLPPGILPEGVRPTLGPDATPLGQVFWYTLEGLDPEGRPAGGWDLGELRSIQDWQVRYELMSVPGVAEVASVGGFVQEYQVEVDPEAMRVYGVSLAQVAMALRRSNTDVGARTIEVNQVEYVIRGLGLAATAEDLGEAAILSRDGVPVRVRDVGRVALGPALRRGALDKGGSEAVGGVVVVRYGENPLAVIQRVRERVALLNPTLPSRPVTVTGSDGLPRETTSKIGIVPFYDRTGLILETLGTLNEALVQQVLITVVVVVVLLLNLRSSALVSGLLPVAVLYCFVAMRLVGVDANIVALSGIAIAIGTMVDIGIVLIENIVAQVEAAPPGRSLRDSVHRAATEVGSAVSTAVLTTVVSFLPVFTMEAAEGRLFKPLAYTNTFSLLSSLLVALVGIPPLALILFRKRDSRNRWIPGLALLLGGGLLWRGHWLPGAGALAVGLLNLAAPLVPPGWAKRLRLPVNFAVALAVSAILAAYWLPLGVEVGTVRNTVFVVALIGGLLLGFYLFLRVYPRLLGVFLARKALFLCMPVLLVVWALMIWLGFGRVFDFVPRAYEKLGGDRSRLVGNPAWSRAVHAFPGLGREFMPDLDEGAFLFMPTTMPHASIGETLDVLAKQDMALAALPEIRLAVGKIGRAESALDPAPISMVETVIQYHDEYLADERGRLLRFRFDPARDDLFRNPAGEPVPAPDGQPYTAAGTFARDQEGKLIPDPRGKPFRLWRPALDPALNEGRAPWSGIRSTNDIWNEIVRVTKLPGTTSAPKLQPIAARNVMLQSGMRAPMGVKIMGKGRITLEELGDFAERIEGILREEPLVRHEAVAAERIVGKPYLELPLDRQAVARHGVGIADVQAVIRAAVGGEAVTSVQHGRERLPVLVRYPRELRTSTEDLERVLVPGAGGMAIPLRELLVGQRVQYRRGPMAIKSENGALVAYVLFDRQPEYGETSVVEAARDRLLAAVEQGRLDVPPGITWEFAGNYQNQLRSERRLRLVLPLSFFLISLILYIQFRSAGTTLMVFSGIVVAWAGGFLMIWLYGQDWFLDFAVFGRNLRDVFQMGPLNLSVAIWVGFIALFGIATDDGVVMATYLDQVFRDARPNSVAEIRQLVLRGALRRVLPCLMTSATTILALLPVLSATGRGADIMVPMAIPCFGGMCVELMTMFVVPVLYCHREERRLRRAR